MIAPVLPTYARAKLSFERGEGVRVFTPEGEAYLDFGAGVAKSLVDVDRHGYA